jgi:hypothetical protein
MRAQRMAKQASPQRNRSLQDSLAAWAEMRAGSEAGQRFCLRFKLDPSSENGALRDPVAWRGINEPHYKTGGALCCLQACTAKLLAVQHMWVLRNQFCTTGSTSTLISALALTGRWAVGQVGRGTDCRVQLHGWIPSFAQLLCRS